MLIAQITDFHVGRVIETREGPVDLLDQLHRTVDRLNSLDPTPDLVMVTGDISNHGRLEDYRATRQALEQLRMPYGIVAGNHDHRQRLRDVFSDHSYLHKGGEFLHCDLSDIDDNEESALRILCLDTLNPGNHNGLLCDQRLQWLDRQLQDQPLRPTLIFMHHPPAPIQFPYMDALRCERGEEMGEIIRRHPQVQGICCGHVHREAVVNWQGTTLFITPSSSFSYQLQMGEVDDIDPLFEPPMYRLFYWSDNTGLVSHLGFVDDYLPGLTEGVPTPPAADTASA